MSLLLGVQREEVKSVHELTLNYVNGVPLPNPFSTGRVIQTGRLVLLGDHLIIREGDTMGSIRTLSLDHRSFLGYWTPSYYMKVSSVSV